MRLCFTLSLPPGGRPSELKRSVHRVQQVKRTWVKKRADSCNNTWQWGSTSGRRQTKKIQRLCATVPPPKQELKTHINGPLSLKGQAEYAGLGLGKHFHFPRHDPSMVAQRLHACVSLEGKRCKLSIAPAVDEWG